MKEDDYNTKEKQNVDSVNPKRNMNISSGIETTACRHYFSLCLESSNMCFSLRLLISHAMAEALSFKSRTGNPWMVSRIDIIFIQTSKIRVTDYDSWKAFGVHGVKLPILQSLLQGG